MKKGKPSERVSVYRPITDVCTELDALHDRLERLEKDKDLMVKILDEHHDKLKPEAEAKKESLRDVLMIAYCSANLPNPSYFENAKCFNDQAQAAKEHFARMIESSWQEWKKTEPNIPFVDYLKKRLEKL
jgi:hypothetical protein